jgi:hypothetical protein
MLGGVPQEAKGGQGRSCLDFKDGRSEALNARFGASFARLAPNSRRIQEGPGWSEVEHPAGIWKRKIEVICQGSIQ